MNSVRPEVTGKRTGGGHLRATQDRLVQTQKLDGIDHNQGPPLELWLELQRLVPLRDAARMLGMSVDTIKRRWPDLIVNPSERCSALRLGDLLKLSGAITPQQEKNAPVQAREGA